jgi:tetraacyldisaccharide 4'-kinase
MRRRGSRRCWPTRLRLPSVRNGDWVRALWDGDAIAARAGRAALVPFELAFAAISGLRGSLYDAGILVTHQTAVPALAIGNLTVGGTGKTPMAAWFARRLRDAGARPGIVLRGYGDDEPRVHRLLNPDIDVIVSPDRVAASHEAKQRGCDLVVFDDAFQHRRADRVANVVVLSADTWTEHARRLLPAGPWRERIDAVRRASLAIVTRKAAPHERAATVLAAITAAANTPVAIIQLAASDLVLVDGSTREPLAALRGQVVLAISAIGDPRAFHSQLEAAGAAVRPAVFRDHHAYTRSDVSALMRAAGECDRIVCTLKDAVKLVPLWPGSTPLWYVSQRVDVERGADLLNDVVSRMLAARSISSPSGRPGPPGSPD